jgi:hypothetical protein
MVTKSEAARVMALVLTAASVAGCRPSASRSKEAATGGIPSIQRLEEAGTPEARAILRQIADGPRALEQQFAAARREGLPVTAAELQAPLPSPDLNAAPIYVQLTRLLKDRPFEARAKKVLVDLGVRTPHTPEEVAAVRALIENRGEVLDLVDQAAAKPQCVFERDWSLGPSMPTPEYAQMREAVRLLRARSYFLAREGRYREALTPLANGLRIANHASMEPGEIAFLVGIACRNLVLAGLEDVLYLAGPNKEVADAVRATLAGNPPAFQMRRALAGEMVTSAVFTEQMHQELLRVGPRAVAELLSGGETTEPPQQDPSPATTLQRLTPVQAKQADQWLKACEADYVGRLRRTLALAAQPYPARHAYQRTATVLPAEAERNPTRMWTAIMFPLVSRLDTKLTTAQARERCVTAAAGILAYHARHGAFPDRLEGELAKLPPDPFTNRPLPYRRERAGFAVSSVGPPHDVAQNPSGDAPAGGPIQFRYPAAPLAP